MTAPGPHGAEKLFQSYPDTVACPSTIVDNPKESMEWVPAWSSGAEDCVNSDVIEPLHRFRLFSSLIQVISSSNLESRSFENCLRHVTRALTARNLSEKRELLHLK